MRTKDVKILRIRAKIFKNNSFYTSFVGACVRVCQPVARSVDSSGRIKLNFIQVFESNVQNVHHYSVNIIEVYFQSFLILISVALELSLHNLSLFYSLYLIW